jgi:hypothetical protein
MRGGDFQQRPYDLGGCNVGENENDSHDVYFYSSLLAGYFFECHGLRILMRVIYHIHRGSQIRRFEKVRGAREQESLARRAHCQRW